MNSAQAAAIAKVEREYGVARVIPPGPLRDRLLKADPWKATTLAVATDRPSAYPVYALIREDGVTLELYTMQ